MLVAGQCRTVTLLRSYRLDYPYFEVRIAKDPAIDEGFIVRLLKAIFPKLAGERGLQFSQEDC